MKVIKKRLWWAKQGCTSFLSNRRLECWNSHIKVLLYLEVRVTDSRLLFLKLTSCNCWLKLWPMSRFPLNLLSSSILSKVYNNQIVCCVSVLKISFHWISSTFQSIICYGKLTLAVVEESWTAFVALAHKALQIVSLWMTTNMKVFVKTSS